MVVSQQEQETETAFGVRSPASIAGATCQLNRPLVLALSFRECVELKGEIGAGERELSKQPRCRVAGDQSLGAAQLGQGTLEISHRSVCRRDVAPHGDLVHLRTG